MKKKVSIVIRTKNEERWITQCLKSILMQQYGNFEVMIVDNKSDDKTIKKAKQFKDAFGKKMKIIQCKNYTPGKALNLGIKEARGSYIAILSGHCIPVSQRWLGNLVRNFKDKRIAGVYGRQEPMSFTADSDKRDLALVFGMDRKMQSKDSFFHNANSAIRKDIWKKIPFDETVTNIEDRVWAQKILSSGRRILYDPEASVYHYHGIHQDGNVERCTNVVRVLESLHNDYKYKSIEIDKLNTIAVIPVKGKIQYLKGKPLLAYTIEKALESKYIKRTIVSTDNPELAKLAKSLGAEVPFIRSPELSRDYVDLDQVLRYTLQKMEDKKIFPDLLVSLEITFPFRPKDFLDAMLVQLAKNGLDSIIAAKRENKAIWKEKEGSIIQLDEGLTPRQFKEPSFIELKGVGFVTHPEFLRAGDVMGSKAGIFELDNPYSGIEVRSKDDFKMAESLINTWS